jgi:hypothetical protein
MSGPLHRLSHSFERPMDSSVNRRLRATQQLANLGVGYPLPVAKKEQLLVSRTERGECLYYVLALEVAQHLWFGSEQIGLPLATDAGQEPIAAPLAAPPIGKHIAGNSVQPGKGIVPHGHLAQTTPRNGKHFVGGVGSILTTDASGEVGNDRRMMATIESPKTLLGAVAHWASAPRRTITPYMSDR